MESPEYLLSEHKLEWDVGDVRDFGEVIETKSYVIHVRDGLDITCAFACHRYLGMCDACGDSDGFQQIFAYELSWPDRENRPIDYKWLVTFAPNAIWMDRRVDTFEGHVSSAVVKPKGSKRTAISRGSLLVAMTVEFRVPTFDPDRVMPMRELVLPLLQGNVLTDVVVVTRDEEIHCHKNILAARSEVFQAMFVREFKEANEGKVEIKHFSTDVVKRLIDFVYSDTVAEDAVSWELFEAARMYSLPRLQAFCLHAFRKQMSVATCCQTLEAAFRHDLGRLFDYTVAFIKRNRVEVSKTDAWVAITENSQLIARVFLSF